MSQPFSLPRQPSFSYTSSNTQTQLPFSGQNLTLPLPLPLPHPPSRRPFHPHNQPRAGPPIYDIMADQDHSRTPPPPTLQHQASRTIIDLTDDVDVTESQTRRSSQRANAPPQLERSDRTILGNVISIDSDDDEIEILSSRSIPGDRPRPLPRSRLQPARPHHHHHHSPRRPRPETIFPRLNLNPLEPPDEMMRHPNIYVQRLADFVPDGWGNFERLGAYVFGDIRQHQARMAGVRMAGEVIGRPEPRKEEHVPPPKAREGFTRSPKEDDVVVCPGCDEEMMVGPEEPTVAKKPGGRQKSKKDREEHPFWVVRECGHVSSLPCSLLSSQVYVTNTNTRFTVTNATRTANPIRNLHPTSFPRNRTVQRRYPYAL